MPHPARTLMKAHVKAYYRHTGGKVVYVPDHDDARPEGREAGLHERTAMGRHSDGSYYLRATDAEDAKAIHTSAQKLGIEVEKRRRGATHHGRVGAYDHFHVQDPTHAAKIMAELGAQGRDLTPETPGGKPAPDESGYLDAGVDRSGLKHGTLRVGFGKDSRGGFGISGSSILHPEHQEAIKRLQHNGSHAFEDETGKTWDVHRRDNDLHFVARGSSGLRGKVKVTDLFPGEVHPREGDKPHGDPKGETPGERNTPSSKEGTEIFHKGDRARYTGTTRDLHGGQFHEVEYLEGHRKGQKEWTMKGPEHSSVTQAHQEANRKTDGERAAKATPPIHAHADALIARGKQESGDEGSFFQRVGEDLKSGVDPKRVGDYIRTHDTAVRDVVYDHIHPDHWKAMGGEALDHGREVKRYHERWNTSAEKPSSDGIDAPKTSESKPAKHPANLAAEQAYRAPNVQVQGSHWPKHGTTTRIGTHKATKDAFNATKKAEGSHAVEDHQAAAEAHWLAAGTHERAGNGGGKTYYSAHSRAQDHHSNAAIYHQQKAMEAKKGGRTATGAQPKAESPGQAPGGQHTPESIAKLREHEDNAGFGYFNHQHHHPDLDRAVAEAANHHGLDQHQVTAFLHGRSGRWAMDELGDYVPKETAREANTLLDEDEAAGEKAWREAHRAIPHDTKVDHFKKWMDPKGKLWKHFKVDTYAEELRERAMGSGSGRP